MPKWIIPKEAAEEIVAKGAQSTGKSVQTFPRAPAENEPQVALFLNQSTWSNKQTRAVIVDANGTATSGAVDVYAPTATSDANLPSTYFHAALIEGRWELLTSGAFLARQFFLQSDWVYSGGVWVAQARAVLNDAGSLDINNIVNVYCSQRLGKPEGEDRKWYCWAVWINGRWESIQGQGYIAGEGIDIVRVEKNITNNEYGGYKINNRALIDAWLVKTTYRWTGSLTIDPRCFEQTSAHPLYPDTAATVPFMLSIRTKNVSVITGVDFTNQTVTRETVKVIDWVNESNFI